MSEKTKDKANKENTKGQNVKVVDEITNKINNTQNISMVLGTLLVAPQLIRDSDYPLRIEDFPTKFHQILYTAIHNLYKIDNVTEVTTIALEQYIQGYSQEFYQIYKQNKGLQYVQTVKQLGKVSTFPFYYNNLKKVSLMKELTSRDIGIKDFFDVTGANKKLNQAFAKMTLADLRDKVNEKFICVRSDWNTIGSREYKASDGMSTLKERLKITPSLGMPYQNKLMTSLTRGQRKKKFVLRSGSTGSGKSRQSLGDSVQLAIPYIFDTNKNKWVCNGLNERVLYISTELEKEEIQTCILAILSGVSEQDILDGKYNEEEEARIDKAIELFEESEFYISVIEDFDIQDIENIIEKHIINYGVEYVFFDYIHPTPKLLGSMTRKTNGMKLREDQILFLFANALKQLANRYEIYLCSSTQLNVNYKNSNNLDTTSLRGANSLGDKLDVGIISLPVTKDDLEKLDTVLKQMKPVFGDKLPTMVHTIFKNRGNKRKGVRVWSWMDLDNVREEGMFVTDEAFNFIPVEPVEVKLEEDQFAKDSLAYLNGTDVERPKELIGGAKIVIEEEVEESNIEVSEEEMNFEGGFENEPVLDEEETEDEDQSAFTEEVVEDTVEEIIEKPSEEKVEEEQSPITKEPPNEKQFSIEEFEDDGLDDEPCNTHSPQQEKVVTNIEHNSPIEDISNFDFNVEIDMNTEYAPSIEENKVEEDTGEESLNLTSKWKNSSGYDF